VDLIVAAVPAELGDLPGLALGIGLVAATATLARRLADGDVGRVLLVGTAGTLPGGPPVGAVVQARRLGLGAPAVTLGLGYQPGAPPVLSGVDLGLPGVDVLTQLAVTTDPDLVARLVPWELEHMEAFGAAWACHAAGVSFGAVFGVANRVGPGAHAEWLANRSGVEAAARDALRAVVAGRVLAGAAGSGGARGAPA